ncbi:hypothetical protein DYB26_012015, partial [Aphanomyces astaci]
SRKSMKLVVQRVTSGCVRVDEKAVGSISKGLVCLVGIGRDDTEDDAELMIFFAVPPEPAKALFDNLVSRVRTAHASPEQVQEGVFGAYMEVSIVRTWIYCDYPRWHVMIATCRSEMAP